MSDRIKLAMIKCIPKNTLSRLIGRFAQSHWSRPLIRPYVKWFRVDVSQAEKPLHMYRSLGEFFTRRLRKGMRVITPGPYVTVSPVDGRIAQFGRIEGKTLFQAKGVPYSLQELLGNDQKKAAYYEGGTYLTLYLSPRDYHRIHMPISGTLTSYTYVPGTLFPVNPFGVRAVAGLFTKNERLITYAETSAGEMAIVKVGATFIGSVRVVYDPALTTNVKRGKYSQGLLPTPLFLGKGEELGLFQFGSTVILLFAPGTLTLFPWIRQGHFLRMGEAIGIIKKDRIPWHKRGDYEDRV